MTATAEWWPLVLLAIASLVALAAAELGLLAVLRVLYRLERRIRAAVRELEERRRRNGKR